MSLEIKEKLSANRIRQWYTEHDGNVYVSFSGGKDSTVLLDLVRRIYPDVPAVFINTGLEYPEIVNFVKTVENVVVIRPEKKFSKVIRDYGYPIISKAQACYIEQYRGGTNYMKELRWNGRIYNGIRNYAISEKWKYLVDAPFKISDKCCLYLKKKPIKKYNKETGRSAFIGTMASDSIERKKHYLLYGCNNRILDTSSPIAFWLEKDIWNYINKYNISYSQIYNMGFERTGCMFCMFGVHLEKNPNRFHLMKSLHPKQYNYCIYKLNMGFVLDYIGVDYKNIQLNIFDYERDTKGIWQE